MNLKLAAQTRNYLAPDEIDQIIIIALQEKNGFQKAAMISMAFRHGLRVQELCTLQWSQINFSKATLQVRRTENGTDSIHPIKNSELTNLRDLLHRQPFLSSYVFTNSVGQPMTPAQFRKMFAHLGRKAKLPMHMCPHMLRHSCGYALASRGADRNTLQRYLGHTTSSAVEKYLKIPEDYPSALATAA